MSKNKAMKIIFRGVRGSCPVAAPTHQKFGGESSCYEVLAGGHRLIFDAGTGIVRVAQSMLKEDNLCATIFMTHYHHDHHFGLPHFAPMYSSHADLAIAGPIQEKMTTKENLRYITDPLVHSVTLKEMAAKKRVFDIKGGETFVFKPGKTKPVLRQSGKTSEKELVVRTVHNPNHVRFGVASYRVEYMGKSFVLATDVEGDVQRGYESVTAEFAKNADLLAMDGQYTDKEIKKRRGWGHSTFKMACQTAKVAGVKMLAIIHHEPSRNDKELQKIEPQAQKIFKNSFLAKQGMVIEL